jgi:uncharacterized glyoxalase superfamily protein PhnB
MSKIDSMTTNLKVESVPKTILFYKDVLGFEISMVLPKENPIWALLKKDHATIMFQQRKSFEEEYPHLGKAIGGSFFFYIKITQLEKFYNEIKDKAKVIKNPYKTSYKMKEFSIEDCNGYLLVFAEDVP